MGAGLGPAVGSGAQVTALVPMKETSVRVPGKNVADVGGRPLFHHVIETLRAARTVSAIAVNTDSEAIKASLRADFPEVVVIDRPAELAGPEVPMNDVIAYDLERLRGEVFLQTHSTNPLLRASTVDAAVEAFLAQDAADSFFSVHAVRKRFYDAAGRAVNHDPAVLLNTQDLPPLYEEDSCLYLFTRTSFAATGARLGRIPRMYEIDPREAVDIDDALDLEIVRALIASGRA